MSWTPIGVPASSACAKYFAVRRQIAGWVMPSSAASDAGSPKTTRPRAGRSRAPSGPKTRSPKRSRICSSAGSPGSTTSRAILSASTTTAPSSASLADTVDFPDPIPPVSPMRSMSPILGRAAGPHVVLHR